MGFLSKVGIAPKEIPLAPVRIGCFLGAGLFILLFAYALVRVKRVKQARVKVAKGAERARDVARLRRLERLLHIVNRGRSAPSQLCGVTA